MENIKQTIKKIRWDILILIVLLGIAIFARTYKIEEIPKGIHLDEAGMAYDAFCLSHFRVDRYLNHLPVYLINFGGGQSILYAYVTAIWIRIFGFTTFSIRITAVIFNILAILAIYFMIKRELGTLSALMMAFLIVINPWNMMASRWGLDCNLLAPMLMISLFFLLRAKKPYEYCLAGIVCGITLYTYALSYMILPIFLGFTILYLLYTKKIHIKQVILLGIPIFILAIPLMLMILVNNGILPEIKGWITIPKLPAYRGAELSLKNIPYNLQYVKDLLLGDEYTYNAVPEFGTVYIFGIALAIFGFFIELENSIQNIRKRNYSIHTIFFILFISVLSCVLLTLRININRANAIFFPIIFFIYSALQIIYKNYKIFFAFLIVVCMVQFVQFEQFYFERYCTQYSDLIYFEEGMIDAIEQVNGREELKNKTVYLWAKDTQPYIYTLLVNPVSPYEIPEIRDLEKNKNHNYGRFIFNQLDLEHVDENAVYIIQNDFDKVISLTNDYAFYAEQFGDCVLLYK